MVRYRKEGYMCWAASERWELPYASIMNDNVQHTLYITLNGARYDNPFIYTASTRLQFVERLNEWFRANNSNYSAELVEPNTDLPALDTSDIKIGTNTYKNRIVVNAKFTTNAWNTISISDIGAPTRAIGKHIKAVDNYYKNNGFLSNVNYGGCCRAKYYDYVNANQVAPTGPITSINSSPSSSASWPLNMLPAKKADFEDNSNCQFLRDNFSTYDDYLESWMVKFPCSAGGAITEFPSGKENTYKLANCTFSVLVSDTDIQNIPLYPLAHDAANTSVNGPNLGKGNWWAPSAAEMVQMMRDVTYGTDSWNTNPDIVNTVLDKMVKFDGTNWSRLSANTHLWTSSMCNQQQAFFYHYGVGYLSKYNFYYKASMAPITIYEF